MKAVDFPQRNVMLAENQPEYETLPVYCEIKTISVASGHSGVPSEKEIPWSMTACFELSDKEIEEIVATKKIWHRQMLYGSNFQPILMSTQNPFE